MKNLVLILSLIVAVSCGSDDARSPTRTPDNGRTPQTPSPDRAGRQTAATTPLPDDWVACDLLSPKDVENVLGTAARKVSGDGERSRSGGASTSSCRYESSAGPVTIEAVSHESTVAARRAFDKNVEADSKQPDYATIFGLGDRAQSTQNRLTTKFQNIVLVINADVSGASPGKRERTRRALAAKALGRIARLQIRRGNETAGITRESPLVVIER
jgi:hypothetical protein